MEELDLIPTLLAVNAHVGQPDARVQAILATVRALHWTEQFRLDEWLDYTILFFKPELVAGAAGDEVAFTHLDAPTTT
jgi:hypothetical protein